MRAFAQADKTDYIIANKDRNMTSAFVFNLVSGVIIIALVYRLAMSSGD